jgi:hypothetical protein
MLKKIVLVGALAVASFVSVGLAGRVSPVPAENTVTMKYPPCDPWAGGGCN